MGNEFHPCLTCWSKVLWFRLWKRSLLYAIIALVLFLKPHRLWLSIASGIQLVILSSLYLMLTYRSRKKTKLIPSPRLLNHSQSPSQDDNDKYEDITDVLDDTLPTPILSGHMSELEQDTILKQLDIRDNKRVRMELIKVLLKYKPLTSSDLIEAGQHSDHKGSGDGDRVFSLLEHHRISLH
ncbi:unnamed protein product [Nezara viridula]|uniref:Uncharacterized protein n=1 Tax=Nezara viridula TaxID=85310 RepID=A0A9P0HR57_NEZVI|nr:unnamed protein product [Nezara viridula]